MGVPPAYRVESMRRAGNVPWPRPKEAVLSLMTVGLAFGAVGCGAKTGPSWATATILRGQASIRLPASWTSHREAGADDYFTPDGASFPLLGSGRVDFRIAPAQFERVTRALTLQTLGAYGDRGPTPIDVISFHLDGMTSLEERAIYAHGGTRYATWFFYIQRAGVTYTLVYWGYERDRATLGSVVHRSIQSLRFRSST